MLISARPEEVQAALRRILESKHFVHAPKKQKFLRLICEFYLNGKAGQLNEYLIGREVFDRTEEYRPTEDPIVRVGAHDVRKKLDLYYRNEGALDDVRLEIPVGSYEPVFLRWAGERTPRSGALPAPLSAMTSHADADGQSLAMAETPMPADEPAASPSVEEQPVAVAPARVPQGVARLVWLWIAVGGLLIVVGGLAWSNYALRQQMRQAGPAAERTAYAGPVWDPFLKTESPILLVLSNPVVYRLVNAGDAESAVKRSIALTPEQSAVLHATMENSFAIRNLPGSPRLLLSPDNYTGVGEAIGAQRVTDLLRTAGKNVLLKRSRTVSAEDLKDSPVVLFGSVWANEWSGKLPVAEDFLYTGQATIENHQVRPGELPVYRSTFDEVTGKLLEDYALITVKPGTTKESVMMILSGLRSAGTEAAAEFATNHTFLAELNQELRKQNAPPYYQALLKVNVENGIPTTIKLLSIHPLNLK